MDTNQDLLRETDVDFLKDLEKIKIARPPNYGPFYTDEMDERDSKAVKEFTESELFRRIIEM